MEKPEFPADQPPDIVNHWSVGLTDDQIREEILFNGCRPREDVRRTGHFTEADNPLPGLMEARMWKLLEHGIS